MCLAEMSSTITNEACQPCFRPKISSNPSSAWASTNPLWKMSWQLCLRSCPFGKIQNSKRCKKIETNRLFHLTNEIMSKSVKPKWSPVSCHIGYQLNEGKKRNKIDHDNILFKCTTQREGVSHEIPINIEKFVDPNPTCRCFSLFHFTSSQGQLSGKEKNSQDYHFGDHRASKIILVQSKEP